MAVSWGLLAWRAASVRAEFGPKLSAKMLSNAGGCSAFWATPATISHEQKHDETSDVPNSAQPCNDDEDSEVVLDDVDAPNVLRKVLYSNLCSSWISRANWRRYCEMPPLWRRGSTRYA